MKAEPMIEPEGDPQEPMSVEEGENLEADEVLERSVEAIKAERFEIRKLLKNDKDLMELDEEKRLLVKNAIALSKMSLYTRQRVAKFMREDEKFKKAIERRSWFLLATYEPYAFSKLAEGMMSGKKDYMRMYMQALGRMPVGSKFLVPPMDDLKELSSPKLDARIEELIARREARKKKPEK